MIFVNYGGGGYYFFKHARWNGEFLLKYYQSAGRYLLCSQERPPSSSYKYIIMYVMYVRKVCKVLF